MNKKTIILICILIALPVIGYIGLRVWYDSYQETMQIGPKEKYVPKYSIPVPSTEKIIYSNKNNKDSHK